MPESPRSPGNTDGSKNLGSPGEPVIPSAWTRPRRRPKREQPMLSRDHIVTEAVRLLDEEGAGALSMRRLGARLNAGATSVYAHVASKDELIELVVDRIYGEMEIPAPDAAKDWRTAAARCAHGIRATILRHSWIAPMLGEVGVSLGPNSLRLNESMLAMLHTAGFALDRADHAVRILFAYVLGMTTSEAAWLAMLARGGRSPEDWTREAWPAIEQATRDYPLLGRRYTEQADGGLPASADVVHDNFDYGLQWLLDGLETRLDADATRA